ncbi:hypothetical protein Q1695_004896 [Nippostrongylus brasiliensis]|nr:hypothetical protein Q1695_004896 [Nippostrongylus brasiliensis]
MEQHSLTALFKACGKGNYRRQICHEHYVDAAAWIVRESCLGLEDGRLINMHLSLILDSPFHTSEVLPEELLGRLQSYVKESDGVPLPTDADVLRFLKESIKYYGARVISLPVDPLSKAAEERREVTMDARVKVEPLVEDSPPILLNTRSKRAKISETTQKPIPSHNYSSYAPIASDEGEPTNPWQKMFLVDGEQLKTLFRFCPSCGYKLKDGTNPLQLETDGTAPVVHVNCPNCLRMSRKKVTWVGQKTIVNHTKVRTLEGNFNLVLAALTSGVSYKSIARVAKDINMAFISKSVFCRISDSLSHLIYNVYLKNQAGIVDLIRSAYRKTDEGEGWDIAVHVSYESRGLFASFCKVLAIDLRTKLCIHTEVVHSFETKTLAGRMKKDGFRRLLAWFKEWNIRIRSITSDRSPQYGRIIEDFNIETGWDARWFVSSWNLAKHFGKQVREASKRDGCSSLKDQISALKTHLLYSVESGLATGDGTNIKHIFNGCLYHVAGVHSWDQDDMTGPYCRCQHEDLPLVDENYIAFGTPAHEVLKSIVLQPEFQRDLCRAGSHEGSLYGEKKKALDRIYCTKDVYLTLSYEVNTAMSTLHMNDLTIRLAELSDERNLQADQQYQEISRNISIHHRWRQEIRESYKTDLLQDLNSDHTTKMESNGLEMHDVTHDVTANGGEDLDEELALLYPTDSSVFDSDEDVKSDTEVF